MNLFNKLINQHLIMYPTPKNLNYIYAIGSILSFLLVIQIITGFIMTFYYIPSDTQAFDTVEIITNKLNYGYLLRFLHMNIATFLFIFLYLHLGKNIYNGFYSKINTKTWIIGYSLFILMVIISFLGYVLPWGQMSFWGSTVITNLAASLPYGNRLVEWIWGDVWVSDITLRRFFSLHYILPFLMLILLFFHFFYLHKKGTTSENNYNYNSNQKTLSLYPFFIIKDLFITLIVFIILIIIISYYPYIFANPVNEIKANPLVTPEHILPEWYFLPFYAILKFIPSKILGISLMGIFVIGPMFMPFLINSKKNNKMEKTFNFNKNQIIIKCRFYIISIVYIIFWVTACTTIFSIENCSLLLLCFFFAIFLPYKF